MRSHPAASSAERPQKPSEIPQVMTPAALPAWMSTGLSPTITVSCGSPLQRRIASLKEAGCGFRCGVLSPPRIAQKRADTPRPSSICLESLSSLFVTTPKCAQERLSRVSRTPGYRRVLSSECLSYSSTTSSTPLRTCSGVASINWRWRLNGAQRYQRLSARH